MPLFNMTNITNLNLQNTSVSYGTIKKLLPILSKLVSLNLRNTGLSDGKGIMPENLTNLTSLNLYNAGTLTNADITRIERLNNLIELNLSYTKGMLFKDIIRLINTLPKLRILDLAGVNLTKDQITIISNLLTTKRNSNN